MMMDFTDLPSELKRKTESRVKSRGEEEENKNFMCLAWSAIG